LNRSLTVALGLLLIFVSFELSERRRVAWWSASVIVALATLLHVGRREWAAVAAGVATTWLLVASRRRFTLRTDPGRSLQGCGIALLAILIAIMYGTVGFWLLETRDLGQAFTLPEAAVRTLRELCFLGNPDLRPITRHGVWFLTSLRLLGAVAAALLAWSVYRPLAYRLRTGPQEHAEVLAIVNRHGRSPLDYFKTWPDKSYFFSPGRSAVIAYRTAWSVAVSLGDPVGPPDELDPLIAGFARFCSGNGWRAAFHQVLPELLVVYRAHGFDVLKVGEEAMVDLERLAKSTSQQRSFRKPCRRLVTEGYRIARERPPHLSALLDEAEEVSDEWLSIPGRRERAFALGRFDRSYFQQTTLAVARDAAGRLVAFLNEVPGVRTGVATVDLMRHRREAPNGVMDYLFCELMLRLHEEGYRWFSLGLAPLAGVGDRPGASLQERAVHQVYEHLTTVFSFKGLRNYKAKFEPLWEERFLVYQDGPQGLIRTALALGRLSQR
jgi:phosphatidylglycerol lysyltransferase